MIGGSGRERAALRDTLQGRIVARLRADPRVLGAWLSGSFGRSEEDEWSDLDLQVAVEDASFEAFLGERPQLYAAVGDPILVQPEMPSDNLSLGDAVYQLVYFRGLILVDRNIGAASKAAKPSSYRLLFEERAFPVAQPERLSQVEWLEQLQWWTRSSGRWRPSQSSTAQEEPRGRPQIRPICSPACSSHSTASSKILRDRALG